MLVAKTIGAKVVLFFCAVTTQNSVALVAYANVLADNMVAFFAVHAFSFSIIKTKIPLIDTNNLFVKYF